MIQVILTTPRTRLLLEHCSPVSPEKNADMAKMIPGKGSLLQILRHTSLRDLSESQHESKHNSCSAHFAFPKITYLYELLMEHHDAFLHNHLHSWIYTLFHDWNVFGVTSNRDGIKMWIIVMSQNNVNPKRKEKEACQFYR